MPLNTEVDYNNVIIKGTVELGVKGERGLQGFKGDQGPPVPVAHELGDDPNLAVSQKLLTDSIADMEQSNEAAVMEATRQAGLAGDSAVIATEQAGIAAIRAGESDQSAQAASVSALAAGQYAITATEQAGRAAGSEAVAENAATRAETARDAAFVNADVYPDIATGRAAVANGEQFQVLSEDGMTYRRYRKDSATVATEVARFPSKAGVPTPYPFHNEASAVPIMLRRAIEDVFVDAPNRSLRLAFHTVQRGGGSGWYLRLAAYLPDGSRDLSVGTAGIVATYLSATNPEPNLTDGKRLQQVSLTPQGTGAARVVDQVLVDIDWEAITDNSNIVASVASYAQAGLSGLVFSGNASTNNLLSRPSLLQDLPRNPKIWAKSNTFSIARLDQVFLDATLYGADAEKRYGFGPITYRPAPGRIILWLSEILPDGTLGDRVAWFDRTGGQAAAGSEGEIETVFLHEYANSGVSASVSVNWSALPANSPNGIPDGWYYAAPPATESELSVFGTSANAGPVAPIGYSVIDFQIEGVNARLTTSDGYGSGGPDTLLLLIHGNGGNFRYEPSASFKAWARANKVSYACIQGQDFTAAPYGSDASGWGGDTHRNRCVKLYDYLMAHYNFHASVVIAGASMGGLVMGQLAYYRPFPIKFCIGIGPVPNLSHIFSAGGENRKSPIRNAYGMAADGSQDADVESFIQGCDWYDLGMSGDASTRKFGFPRMYLYAGDGDATYTTDFGGAVHYNAIRDSIQRAGGYCTFTVVSGASHADATVWDRVLSDGVMDREGFAEA